MRNTIFFLTVLLMASCSPQKNVGSSSGSSSESANKGSKMYGKVIVKSSRIGNEMTEMPILYFDINGVEYLINVSQGKVPEAEIKKHLYKSIDILGEIKTEKGSGDINKTRSEKENFEKLEGNRIIFFKILDQ